jgi:hypothetical protein
MAELPHHSELFQVVASLCGCLPDSMRERLPDLLPAIAAGVRSTELDVQFEALNAVAVAGDAADFLDILHDCAARASGAGDGYDGSLMSRIAGRAVVQIALLVAKPPLRELLAAALSDVVAVASSGSFLCRGCAARALFCLVDLVAGPPVNDGAEVAALVDDAVAVLVESVSPADSDDVVSMDWVLMCLAELVKKCGVEVLGDRHMALLGRLSDMIGVLIDNSIGESISKETLLKPISRILIRLAYSTTPAIAQAVIERLVPVLAELLHHCILSIRCFAIKIFAEIFSKKSILNTIPAEFRGEVFDLILQSLADGPAPIAAVAANFVATLSLHEDGRPLVEEHAKDTLHAIITRLRAIDRLTSANIGLRESLVHAATAIGQQVLADAFPIAEVLPAVLECLPIRKRPKFAGLIYEFINGVFADVPQELRAHYIRIYAWVFARPYSQMRQLKIKSLVLFASTMTLDKALADFPEPDDVLKEALDNDEYRISCFLEVFPKYRESIEKARGVWIPDI